MRKSILFVLLAALVLTSITPAFAAEATDIQGYTKKTKYQYVTFGAFPTFQSRAACQTRSALIHISAHELKFVSIPIDPPSSTMASASGKVSTGGTRPSTRNSRSRGTPTTQVIMGVIQSHSQTTVSQPSHFDRRWRLNPEQSKATSPPKIAIQVGLITRPAILLRWYIIIYI